MEKIEKIIDELVSIILTQEKELKQLRGELNGNNNTSGDIGQEQILDKQT